jgi:hypothetical protein
MAKILRMMLPPESVEYYVNMSPKLLQYSHANDEDWTWNNKLLVIEDASQELLDSEVVKVFMTEEGKAGTVQDGIAIDLVVNGRPTVLITTAKSEITPEFSHRNVIIPFIETPDQRKLAMENMVLGNVEIKEPYNDILSKLKLAKVNIPYKRRLPKCFPSENNRAIRDFKYFLIMIECSAVLHQYNREQRDGKIIAEQQDYEIAIEALNALGDEGVLGLTNTQRKLHKQMLELGKDGKMSLSDEFEGFTVHELESKIGNRAKKNWYEILDALVIAGCVVVKYKEVMSEREDKDGNVILRKTGRDVAYYKPLEPGNIYKLPRWEELIK